MRECLVNLLSNTMKITFKYFGHYMLSEDLVDLGMGHLKVIKDRAYPGVIRKQGILRILCHMEMRSCDN